MSVTFTNCTYAYITNDPYKYPSKYDGKPTPIKVETGWHIIPNQQYGDWLTPKQWFTLMYEAESFSLAGCSVTVQNMIPLTSNPAIQGTASFTAFNNTIYALGYTDNCYETVWRENDKLTLWEREGVSWNGTTATRYMIPQYEHIIWNTEEIQSIGAWESYFWDPMVLAEDLQELRPGKNAIKYAYSAGKQVWYNTTVQQQFDPNWSPAGANKPAIYSITAKQVNNFKLDNITPHNNVNAYISTEDTHPTCDTAAPSVKSAAPWNHITIQKPSTVGRSHGKPCPQWFIKMIPIFDENGALIKTTAQVCMYRTITFNITPKKRAINMPLYPPMTHKLDTHYNYVHNVLDNSGWLSASAGVSGNIVDTAATTVNE